MTNEKLAEMYQLVEKAKMMEKMGQESQALDIYLSIHKNHIPNTSFLFERPVVILEKKKRYQEALELCDKAIDLIGNNKITGTVDHFQKKKDRILEKMNEGEGNKPKKVESPLNFKLKIDISPLKAILGFLLFTCLIMVILFFIPKTSPLEDLYIDMAEFETKSKLEGKIFEDKHDPDLPPITESMVKNALSTAKLNENVLDVRVLVSGELIGIAIQVKESTTTSEAKRIGIDFFKTLSGMAASESPTTFGGPSKSSYGKLYDYYGAFASVGIDPQHIKAKGTLEKEGNKTKWLDN